MLLYINYFVCLINDTFSINLRVYYLFILVKLLLYKKVDNLALGRMEYFEIVEYAHTYEKLERQNVSIWISNFKLSIMKVLLGFLHIEETVALFTTSNQSNNANVKMKIKLVSANALMFLVLEKACEDD